MIALALLAVGLIALVGISTRDARASHRAKMLTIATGLARVKMYDIEEELQKTGFQDTAEQMEGDFSDQGQPRFTWSAVAERIYLPEMPEAPGADDKEAPAAPGPTDKANQENLLNLAGGSAGGALGASMVQLYFPLIRPVLENAIRRVTLTVKWKIGNDDESFQVICFFTDTKAIDQAMRGPGAADTSGGTATPPGGAATPSGGGIKK